MSKTNNQSGFSAVEALLILIVVGILGFTGWYVLKAKSNTDKSLNSNHSTTPVIAKKSMTKATTPQTTDPYAGWKSYCDTATSGCFKYPSNWNDLIRGTDVTALGGNKGETVTLEYNEPTDANGGLGTFSTKSVNPVTISGSSYEVVGGYYTVSNVPGYYLVDTSLVQQLGLKAGATSNITNNDLYFTFASKKVTFVVHYNTAASGGAATIATSTANAWFTSTDGQTALSTVRSFYKQ